MPRPANPERKRRWPVVTAAFFAMGLALSVAVAVALTGFSTPGFTVAGLSVPGFSVGPTPTAKLTSGDETLGRCWQATQRDAAGWHAWDGGGPVPCAGDHTLYTFAVEKLSRLPGTTWAAEGSPQRENPEVSPAVADAVSGTCESALSDLFPARTWKQQRVTSYSYLPTEAEWAAGERWVRCDVAVLAIGSLRDAPELGKLPGDIQTLAHDLEANPAKYYYCLAMPGGEMAAGPIAEGDAMVADCRDSPAWILTGREQLAGAAGEPYPANDTIFSLARDACGTTADWLATGSTTRGWVDYPSEGTWRTGSRQVTCWLEGE